jgi:hypothetical protein
MICKWCGKEFDAPNSKVKYCSDYCRKKKQYAYEKEFHKKRRASRPNPIKVCLICGKEFERTNENRKFCCDECRKEQARRQKAAFHRLYTQEQRKKDAELKKAIQKMTDDVYQPEYEARKLDGKVLHKAEMTVDEYNRTHGTNYSYGQYVHYVESRG